MSKILHVGDEESFLNYEEKVVYDLQKAWSGKQGMEGMAVMDICARLEDLIYNDALKEYNLSATANVWSKKECIIYYQEKCDSLVRCLESKDINWKKLFDESKMNTRYILQTITKSDGDRKFKSADTYKAASRALMPKARNSAVGFSVGRGAGAPKKKQTTGKKGAGRGSALVSSTQSSTQLHSYVDGDSTLVSTDNFDDGNYRTDAPAPTDPLQALVADEESNLEFGFDFSNDAFLPQSGGMIVENEDAWRTM